MIDISRGFDFAGFSSTITARIGAEARIVRAKTFGLNAAGLGLCAALWGVGIGFAFFGYSKTTSSDAAANRIASAVAEGISRAQVKTIVGGTMMLAPTAELRLAGGQTVGLDPATTVSLDPDSTVKMIGDFKLDVPQPSKEQLQVDTTSISKELPSTRYTVFRFVRFGSGSVVTAWNFELTDTATPNFQRCYYEEILSSGVSAIQNIAFNGLPKPPNALNKMSFDFDGAVANCIWFAS
ncbi:hypothetical protein [Bradyrhizobium sp. SZCCHNR1093]|uniref:hypothetical protein n=1 Tax=Bradyrhizobium sp. SZCCHNR1093 TaxID=3057368 RepID=UPI0028E5E4CC|nr:hypothetical protein [Bradyrhizobium sp. SZCCHNR1093]